MTTVAYPMLREIIDQSNRIVFFGGAGVSTESGLPDFRSQDGLYSQTYDYPPETILSHSFFVAHMEEFYRFYKAKLICPEVKPNAAHYALSQMEEAGKLIAVVTQNIDGLHQMTGSRTVYELHGSVHRNICATCKQMFPMEIVINSDGVPHCPCGGIIKPDVVLYEEPLNQETIAGAVNAISTADTLIVGGTSLNVYPAAGLIRYFEGAHMVLINKEQTSADYHAELVIRDPIGHVLGSLTIIK
ncbi:MAG: NAD-dependent protein deacylase [Dehalococcoidia bacterium]|nr:NAD-dependent protein deacylase [Dehalococcoidia bacterium]